jgi:hypothetical protein
MLAFAGSEDRHEGSDPASALYRQSVFAHGYIHGYEAGFHLADDDYQMGRGLRDVPELKQFKEADEGYRDSFGNKEDFKRGYREGMRAGYDDSFHNRPFRAVSAARLASEGLVADGKVDWNFESGFVDGFQAAEAGAPQSCFGQKSRPAARMSAAYCDGFNRGIQFGLQLPSMAAPQSAQVRPATAAK